MHGKNKQLQSSFCSYDIGEAVAGRTKTGYCITRKKSNLVRALSSLVISLAVFGRNKELLQKKEKLEHQRQKS